MRQRFKYLAHVSVANADRVDREKGHALANRQQHFQYNIII
jgi:hypothetical protein